MKKFTIIFCTLIIGVAVGYAWAYKCYMPMIQDLNKVLKAYQEYTLKYEGEEEWKQILP